MTPSQNFKPSQTCNKFAIIQVYTHTHTHVYITAAPRCVQANRPLRNVKNRKTYSLNEYTYENHFNLVRTKTLNTVHIKATNARDIQCGA